ncbi:MAG TPA: helix-turn-helix transcriptional regulator [Pseudosphingobacterium sp.]|nr:helix-turn-helix transcriptional regulator [Pseudosphingobacterium sp.]
MSEKLNKIKEALAEAGVSGIIAALYLGVHEGTISSWNSNKKQPHLSDIDKLADLLESDNVNLVRSKPREKTGLAGAVVNEYKRIMKEGKIPLYVNATNAKGNPKNIFNPELVKKIQDFVEKYKKEHGEK